MALLKANRTVQSVLWAEFVFNLTDTMVNTSDAETAFGAAAGTVFDIIGLPPNAVVVDGDMTVETASNDAGATATLALGDSGSATRYLAATSIKAAARTALTLTGYRGTGQSIRATLVNTNGDATAGKVSIRVGYIVTGRASEVLAR